MLFGESNSDVIDLYIDGNRTEQVTGNRQKYLGVVLDTQLSLLFRLSMLETK